MEDEAPAPPPDSRRIHVTGFPGYTQRQDLSTVFATYGSVKVDKITNKFALLTFDSEDDAKDAVKDTNKVNIYGEFLTVKHYVTPKEPATPKREFVWSKQKGVVIEPRLISLTGDFHTQLDNILSAVRLTQEEVTALSKLYVDLEYVLQQQWPGCVALPFGSITTGLGTKSSDADCFIQVPAEFRVPGANFVNKAKRLLQQYPRLFTEILSIPRANTPIVKFFHIPTQINCDVTFKTPLGAQNSKLIAFLLHADPRLIPMAVVIKYWAKVHSLSGTGKLTNYALTMLIIFYLQQEVAILPSIEWLQRDPSNDIIVDNWNTGFMHNHELLPKSNNTQTISALLGGFFLYYSKFNFEQSVVCPFTGYAMNKELFKDFNNLPPQFERYKRNIQEYAMFPLRVATSMCVQDPIEQSHNVASAITSKLAGEIKAYFKFAAIAYEKEKRKEFASFFKTILLQKPKLPKKSCPEFRLVMYPHILQCIANADWTPVVRDVMIQMFEGICKIPLTRVEVPPNPEAKRLRERYNGTIVKAIWKRKQFNRLYSMSKMDFLKRQIRITEEVLNVEKESLKVNFQFTLAFCTQTRNVTAAVKLLEGDAFAFKEFGKFFITSMQNWYISLLKPYFHPLKKPQDNAPVANGSKSDDSSLTEKTEEDCIDVKVDMVQPEDLETSESEVFRDINSTTIDMVQPEDLETSESEVFPDKSSTSIDTKDLNNSTDSNDAEVLNEPRDSSDTITSPQ